MKVIDEDGAQASATNEKKGHGAQSLEAERAMPADQPLTLTRQKPRSKKAIKPMMILHKTTANFFAKVRRVRVPGWTVCLAFRDDYAEARSWLLELAEGLISNLF